MRRLLTNVLPEFEFPRKNLYDYVIETKVVDESEVQPEDFVIGTVWNELDDSTQYTEATPEIVIDNSYFNEDLTPEEIYILAILMMNAWLQRQITSIENTRMKYTGSDFKMTSQANHLAKLLSLQTECQRQSFHLQRLYKRRKLNDENNYKSTWKQFGKGVLR